MYLSVGGWVRESVYIYLKDVDCMFACVCVCVSVFWFEGDVMCECNIDSVCMTGSVLGLWV